MTVLLIINASIAAFLVFVLIIVLGNLLTLRSLKDYPASSDQPRVSVLVPARDEEEDIANCVNSLLAQDYANYEVIVLDDNSTDNTWQILQGIAAKNDRLKIDKGLPLEQGWLGKHWGCHQLAQKAGGEFLLFTDADTVHQPSTLSRAVAAMQKEKAGLITLLPRQVMGSLVEYLNMPFSNWTILCFLPLWLAYRTKHPALTAASGPFMLFRKTAYDATGGFASIRGRVVDDVELCRRIRTQGLRWRILDGHHNLSVRQFTSAASLIEGHTKNLFAQFQFNAPACILTGLFLLLIAWLPIISLITALLTGATAISLSFTSAACIIMLLATWIISCLRFGFPLWTAFLYPVSITMMAGMAFRSIHLHYTKKATWKGRVVSPGS